MDTAASDQTRCHAPPHAPLAMPRQVLEREMPIGILLLGLLLRRLAPRRSPRDLAG